MKQPFVNATINDRRKGKEHSSQTTHAHPLRPTAINSEHAHPHAHALPVKVAVVKKAEPSELDKMKVELMKMMAAVEKKPKAVSKSKLIGMAMASAAEEAPMKDYTDVLAMLLAKK